MAESEPDPIKRLKKYEGVVARAKEILEKDNYFEEDVGSFWGIMETRPYMRARQDMTLCLIELGRYSQAIIECEDMLRLCENDNTGVRYILMGLYCVLEKFDEGEILYKKYKDNAVHMLLPLAVLYF